MSSYAQSREQVGEAKEVLLGARLAQSPRL